MGKENNKIHVAKDVKGVAVVTGGEVHQTINIHNSQATFPHQLSSKLSIQTNFIGREEELKAIEESINEADVVLLIHGIGGVGKSAIAGQYLSLHKDEFLYYGFFEGINNFITELQSSLDLTATEDANKDFLKVLAKLRALEGEKLFVIDDVKNIEKNRERIEKILALKEHGFQLLLTSREVIENLPHFELDVMSLRDSKNLFNAIYPIDDEPLLEEILEYLDYHTLFIEITAKTLKNKKSLSALKIKKMFESGEFSKISVKRRESFNNYLTKIFNFEKLDEEEILTLKKFSLLPSIGIKLAYLSEIFQTKEDELEEILDYLTEKGWLTDTENSYKLHQIIKEYILENHRPKFDEIEGIVNFFNNLMGDTSDLQVAIDNKNNLVYLNAISKALKERDKKVGEFLNNLALLYEHLGIYEKSLPLYKRAVEIKENIYGCSHSNTAMVYNNFAGLYQSMGEYDNALPLYEKALSIWEADLGETHPDTATSHNNLAGVYKSLGKFKKALPLYEKSLKTTEALLGTYHSNTASAYNNLALLYDSMGEYKKALPLLEKSVEIKEKVLGESHPNTATSYNNLAELYRLLGDYDKALPLYAKALSIWEKVLGSFHTYTANSYWNLALFYKDRKFCSKSIELLEKTLFVATRLKYFEVSVIDIKKTLKQVKDNLKKEKKLNFKKRGRYCKEK